MDGQLFVDLLVNAKSLTTWDNYERFHRATWEQEADQIKRRYPSGLSQPI